MLPVPPQFYYYPYWASSPDYFLSPQFHYHYALQQGAALPYSQPTAGYPYGVPGPLMGTPPSAAYGAQMAGPSPMFNMGYFMQMPQTAQINYQQYLQQTRQYLADQLKKIDEILSTMEKEKK